MQGAKRLAWRSASSVGSHTPVSSDRRFLHFQGSAKVLRSCQHLAAFSSQLSEGSVVCSSSSQPCHFDSTSMVAFSGRVMDHNGSLLSLRSSLCIRKPARGLSGQLFPDVLVEKQKNIAGQSWPEVHKSTRASRRAD